MHSKCISSSWGRDGPHVRTNSRHYGSGQAPIMSVLFLCDGCAFAEAGSVLALHQNTRYGVASKHVPPRLLPSFRSTIATRSRLGRNFNHGVDIIITIIIIITTTYDDNHSYQPVFSVYQRPLISICFLYEARALFIGETVCPSRPCVRISSGFLTCRHVTQQISFSRLQVSCLILFEKTTDAQTRCHRRSGWKPSTLAIDRIFISSSVLFSALQPRASLSQRVDHDGRRIAGLAAHGIANPNRGRRKA